MAKRKPVIDEKAKDELIALASANANDDELYKKYSKVRNAALRLRSVLIRKYGRQSR